MRLVEEEEVEPVGDRHLSEGRMHRGAASVIVSKPSGPRGESGLSTREAPQGLGQRQTAPLWPLRILLRSVPAQDGPVLPEDPVDPLEEDGGVARGMRQVLP